MADLLAAADCLFLPSSRFRKGKSAESDLLEPAFRSRKGRSAESALLGPCCSRLWHLRRCSSSWLLLMVFWSYLCGYDRVHVRRGAGACSPRCKQDIYIITDLMDTDLHRIIRSSQVHA